MNLQFIVDDPWQALWLVPAILFFATMIYISRGWFLLMLAVPFGLAVVWINVAPVLFAPFVYLGEHGWAWLGNDLAGIFVFGTLGVMFWGFIKACIDARDPSKSSALPEPDRTR